MIPTEANEKVYTINKPEADTFKKFADTENMCKGWSAMEDMGGWITISVPNWTAGIPSSIVG